MPSPATTAEFLGLVRKSGLIDEHALSRVAFDLPTEPAACADALVEAELLTAFQAKQLLAGRARGLTLGQYRILRPLGKGGMGIVYLAEHTGLKRKSALKVLNEEQSREQFALERLFREARAAAALDHPNIVRLHDIAQSNGTHFLVMEFVDGTDFQALIEQTGSLHAAQAAGYIAQAAAGLQHAHDKGIIHRDIKPANLIVGKNGVVKILDMGLARSLSNPKDALTGQISEEIITGTADFLSPEQALNVRLDMRTDIYSLGGTFYTLLTGRPPYEGSTAQKLAQHQMAAPPDVRASRFDVPPEMAAIIARMMAKKPEERYQTANEVIAALAPWVPGIDAGERETVTAESGEPTAEIPKPDYLRPTSPEAQGPRPRRRWVAVAVVVSICIAGIAAGLLYLAFGRIPKSDASDPAPVAPQLPVAPAARADKLIPAFDFSGVQAFKFNYEDGIAGEPNWRSLVPNGVYLHCWKRESVAEFRSEADAGRAWIGVTNLNSDVSSQVLFQLDEGLNLSLVPGKRYRVRLEYRTAKDADGWAYIRNPKDEDFSSVAEARLDRTEGTWKTVEMTFRRPTDGKLDVCIVNNAVGEGNTLAVRLVELFEIAEDGK
jgi:tRNA A-37 threonylcarbamoyl transferase component Bud32